MQPPLNRRRFLRQSVLSATGLWLASPSVVHGRGSANGRINVGFIGVANRAADDLAEVAKEAASVNVVALCDVDENYLAPARQRFPAAKTHRDFRRLIDQKDIDAIVVGTPDHTHAVAVAAALRSGRHVYCEKPLTRTISECRAVRELAARHQRITQLGTQIHAGKNYRRVVELIQSDVIGSVREVHVWVGATYGGIPWPTQWPPVPAGLDWDLWLGPVQPVPYHPDFAPARWRNWWAFGGGALADFGCHFMDLPHWALDLRHPVTVEPLAGPPVDPRSTPPWAIIRYQYPERKAVPGRAALPPLTLTWYHGGRQPSRLTNEQREYFKSGVLFVGDRGELLADYTRNQLLPEAQFAGFTAPAPFLPDSIGHHKEWLEAIKTGGLTTCDFDYAGALTETVLLGNVAYRVGRRLEWDPGKLRATNCAAAGPFIQHHYRPGWKL